MMGTSCVAAQLAACQEELSSMNLVFSSLFGATFREKKSASYAGSK
jgi:hypothetical protein